MDDATRRLVNRWRSIEGHARGVERMIADEAYCTDILKQTLAIQGAIERVNAAILERHLQTCVAAAIRSDDPAERERVIRELLEVMKGTGHLRRVASTGEVLESVAEALADGGSVPEPAPTEAGPT
ncbi:MAG: metal-sensitive transcriptional regulator [Chloroflexi bacterium]|nr:metal-sensitive transcriptional regulator [Chloroflexota bacterium]